MRIIAAFEKSERVRHIGHLDIQRAVQRGLRRSGLPVGYSNGFNPHILVSFASALSTGACGERELMDVKMAEEVSPEVFLEKMNGAMPPEMRLTGAWAVDDRHPSLSSGLQAAVYEIRLRDAAQAKILTEAVSRMMKQDKIPVSRKTKSGVNEVDMKPLIYSLQGEGQILRATLKLTEKESCKPVMILEGLKKAAGLDPETEVRSLVIRKQLLGMTADGTFSPLENL